MRVHIIVCRALDFEGARPVHRASPDQIPRLQALGPPIRISKGNPGDGNASMPLHKEPSPRIMMGRSHETLRDGCDANMRDHVAAAD